MVYTSTGLSVSTGSNIPRSYSRFILLSSVYYYQAPRVGLSYVQKSSLVQAGGQEKRNWKSLANGMLVHSSKNEVFEVGVAVYRGGPAAVRAAEEGGEEDAADFNGLLAANGDIVELKHQRSVKVHLDVSVGLARCVEVHELSDVLPMSFAEVPLAPPQGAAVHGVAVDVWLVAQVRPLMTSGDVPVHLASSSSAPHEAGGEAFF